MGWFSALFAVIGQIFGTFRKPDKVKEEQYEDRRETKQTKAKKRNQLSGWRELGLIKFQAACREDLRTGKKQAKKLT